jgi:hypothetical protein
MRWRHDAETSSGEMDWCSRADSPAAGPGSGAADPRPGMIDSSFFRLYTGPPKPPVLGDLAGSDRGSARCSNFTRHATPAGTGISSLASLEGAASRGSRLPGLVSPLRPGSAAWLRSMMDVFPLAETMSFSPNSPLSRGGGMRASNGRIDEVWWHPHPNTSSGLHAAAAHSPIRYIDHIAKSHASARGPRIGPPSRPARGGR